ncbi:broad specificity 5'(3')-nucleotidase and polyphosphatase [uncultured Gammaproteobacteria bacterium]
MSCVSPAPAAELSRARILLSNDDGIQAPGLAVLERIAHTLSDDVWVVAPETEQSGVSHSLTIHRPLRLRQLGERRFAVDGTPTDCVLMAINHILRDQRPTLVLSGVNAGSNLGEDVTYSGTIAAAMEGCLLGVPSLALSQHVEPGTEPDWRMAEHWGAKVVRQAMAVAWPDNVLININFPVAGPTDDLTGPRSVRVVRQGRRKLGDEIPQRFDPRGRPYYWIGAQRREDTSNPDTDIGVIMAGGIAVTPLYLDLTHPSTLETLREVFS